MNIYTKKRSWKVFLLVFASVIVTVSLWYTNGFIHKLALNEKEQVELWAKAISRKADLVNNTEILFENLRQKEKRYVFLWSEATKKLISSDNNADIEFFTGIISGNKDIPVIVTDEEGNVTVGRNLSPKFQKIKKLTKEEASKFTSYKPIVVPYFEDQYNYIYYRNSNTYYELKKSLQSFTESFLDEILNNSSSTPVIITDSTMKHIIAFSGSIDSTTVNDSVLLNNRINEMRSRNHPIEINLSKADKKYVFYDDSMLLTKVRYFPIVLLISIGIFLLTSYRLFSSTRKSEQSKVWAGMAKETAHQLGTPISSLMGWVEVMKLNYPDEEGFNEMNKDIQRLTVVSERFSKIGSTPELKDNDIISIINGVVDYMRLRIPKKIEININNSLDDVLILKLNKPLIIWVFENLIRNAVDAIGSESGKIDISIVAHDKGVAIEVKDSGKGIPKTQYKTIFNPGFSTKTRGWGLGLSLTKRIIEEYHLGKIFVKISTVGIGSTFRIILK